jgi:two-component system cell cycle sensor histidine kinase/response regulator CckA
MIQQAAPDGQTFATAEQAATWRPGPATETLTGTETILFVEDEEFVREVTGEILRSAGYRVLTAKDAVTAGSAYDLQGGDVDLLLTDVVLPGESGHVLAGRLRRTSPKLKVLLITGYAEQMGEPESGIGACLAKPFSVGVLLQKVRQVLDCSEASDWIRKSC